MKELNDKKRRQELIRRYLNAETTIEEECLLLKYYMQTEEELTLEEEDAKLIIVSTKQHTWNFGLSDEKEAEFDRMMEGRAKEGKSHSVRISSVILWPASLAAAIILAFILTTKETEKSIPTRQQYAKNVNPTPSLRQVGMDETPPQKEKEEEFQLVVKEAEIVSSKSVFLAHDEEKRETNISLEGEMGSDAKDDETPGTEIYNTNVASSFVERNAAKDPKDMHYPVNVTAANYGGRHKYNNRFVPFGNITITTKTRFSGNATHYAVVNTRNGVKVLYPETPDDSVLYIVDGERVTMETATRIAPDSIIEMRRLERGSSEAIKEDPDGQTHDIILITRKKSNTDGQDHSLVPHRNGLLVSDNDNNNGICLL